MADQSIFRIADVSLYSQWIQNFDNIDDEEIEFLKMKISRISVAPQIAIVPVPTRQRLQFELSAFKKKFADQIYGNWHIYEPTDFNITNWQPENTPAILFSDPILEAAETADYILPLPLDAFLRPHALATFVLTIIEVQDADIIYADEDIMRHGIRSEPRFKTDWDPFFILGCHSVGIPALYRSEAIKRSRLRNLMSTTVDNLLHAVTLCVSEITAKNKIYHIPSVLCHRTQVSDWNGIEARRNISAHLANLSANIIDILPSPIAPGLNRVRFSVPEPAPLVSIIIPTRDRASLIGTCADGILNHTGYPSLELIIIDNGTTAPDALAVLDSLKRDIRVRILRDDGAFNYSRLNNTAARVARGDILVLMNNDIEIIDPDWLKEMVSLASRPDIGVAGAKLLYPDQRVQHAGISFGPDKVVAHQMRLAHRHETGPQGELGLLRSVSAVSGACMAIRRDIYFEAGLLNENQLTIAFNDLDLCRRIARKGLAIVWTPFAELIHHESVSRGAFRTPEGADREASESIVFWSMNKELFELSDPFHNPQIEFKHNCVDFARPPRLHQFRSKFREPKAVPFFY